MRTAPYLAYHRLNDLWRRYAIFINRKTRSTKKSRTRNEIWKDRFFTQIIKFAIPTGIISLIASMFIECSHGHYITAIIDALAFVSILLIVLGERVSIRLKKQTGVFIMLLFSVLKMVTLHSLMFGAIFLLLLSLFITLLFNKKMAYLSVLVNALVCILFGIVWTKAYPLYEPEPLNDGILDKWMLYTFNFVFSNLVMVSVVLYIINGFEKTIQKSEKLYLKLQLEVQEKIAKENLLQESITHYKSLFFFNPLPMLIYEPTTLQLLYVNKSAINCYGYTKRELLEMKVNGLLQCKEEVFRSKIRRDYVHQTDTHFNKNGEHIIVDINASNIKLNGAWVRLAIVRDITQEVEHIAAIENKNKKMEEIAYLQSHVIRNPLSKILGILKLLNAGPVDTVELEQCLAYLMLSAEELDTVVVNIVRQTEEGMKKHSS